MATCASLSGGQRCINPSDSPHSSYFRPPRFILTDLVWTFFSFFPFLLKCEAHWLLGHLPSWCPGPSPQGTPLPVRSFPILLHGLVLFLLSLQVPVGQIPSCVKVPWTRPAAIQLLKYVYQWSSWVMVLLTLL